LYPYLRRYVSTSALVGKRVLEIGLGYGTLGQMLARHARSYVGVDIAPGPPTLMKYRVTGVHHARAIQSSALDLPFEDGAFDAVYTIGCLHHTGNVARGVAELYRVLAPSGQAVVMLYNRFSFRLLCQAPRAYFRDLILPASTPRETAEDTRRLYDANAQGDAAPHTEFVSRRDVRRLFRAFSHVAIERQNVDTYVLLRGRLVVPRTSLLSTLGRCLGLDLYIVATK
jgi:ubiquinone/menaquinone biosynthesis C-methylase UbiE